MLKCVMLCFSRDESVRQLAEYEIHKPLLHHGSVDQDKLIASPPSAVQPFLGLSAYFAPLGYLFNGVNQAALYGVARALYCQFWCRLNVICSDNGTLLQTCATFEHLLSTVQPRLYLHLVKIGVNPLHIALPWIQLGFVGILEVDQILILWDRLFGYMDTSLLAVLAAAIFIFRSPALMLCTNVTEVNQVMSDGLKLRVLPLLQLFLFSETNPNAN